VGLASAVHPVALAPPAQGDATMKKLFTLLVTVGALALGFPAIAQPVGPNVGRNCVASWTAVTTNTDGSPASGITYNLYLQTTATPVPVPGVTTPTLAAIPGVSATPCIALAAAGQYHGWVTAVETLAGSASESVLSADFPFVLVIPNRPTLTVK
jgi:hypothetical protein